MDILLIHPPVTRPCEPPAGLAKIMGALQDHGSSCHVLDANIEGLLYLTHSLSAAEDTWTRRALNHREENIASLREGTAFRNPGSYNSSVGEINRILTMVSARADSHVTLNNYAHDRLSPVKSSDLLRSARQPENNVFYPYFKERFVSIFEEHTPRIAGFSLNYLSQALTCFAMIGCLRSISPDTKIIVGGGLVTSWIKRPGWNNPFAGLVDELVAGPGEARILEHLGKSYSGREALPEYAPLWNNEYLSPGRVVPFSTSFGCYWGKCSFCPEKAEGNAYAPLSAERALSDMKTLGEKHSPSLVHICDNAISPKLLTSLAETESMAPWYGFARITDHLSDPDFCRALKRSGCAMIKLGLESGDQRVLDELNKGIDLAVAARVLKALKLAGIATYVYLLFGTPPEDLASARKTLAFLETYHDCVDFLNLSIFNLPRESTEAARLETYDFSQGDLSLYQGFRHPKGWDRNNVRQFLDKEFKRHRAMASIVRNDPPVFTSNHAPFFVMDGTMPQGKEPE
ncbi:MAG TPA: radical SAM protein [Deltaproteobacteria bacterium]|nr:radical SAM protein [Deltaproteobacteria bacterium]HPJ94662.1 radical SAM protein [Deltaproteobacteria bacterium]HPR51064.1 radical SAM protein [Deltaproteobacteria bacterium]